MQAKPVDWARVYVTGISMGGHGAVALVAAEPARYAAVAPICGWAERPIRSRLRTRPIWAFHGTADDIVPVEDTRLIVLWFGHVTDLIQGHDSLWCRSFRQQTIEPTICTMLAAWHAA